MVRTMDMPASSDAIRSKLLDQHSMAQTALGLASVRSVAHPGNEESIRAGRYSSGICSGAPSEAGEPSPHASPNQHGQLKRAHSLARASSLASPRRHPSL